MRKHEKVTLFEDLEGLIVLRGIDSAKEGVYRLVPESDYQAMREVVEAARAVLLAGDHRSNARGILGMAHALARLDALQKEEV